MDEKIKDQEVLLVKDQKGENLKAVTGTDEKGRRNGFQPAFLVRICDGFDILVLLILDQKDFLVFDFFVHVTIYLMAPTAVHGQK